MKKLTVLFLLGMFVSCGFAQSKYSITPEIGYNKTSFYNTAQTTEIVTAPLYGIELGGLVTKSGKKGLFIESGLFFEQKGSYQGRGYQALYGTNSNIKISYLQVPLNVGLHKNLKNKDWGILASVGVYGAYGISGSENGTSLGISGTSNINRNVTFVSSVTAPNSNTTYIKPLDFGYQAAVGASYKNLIAKIGYSRGFNSVSPDGSTSYKNDVWTFSLGYKINLL
jgi:hypothetical protein